MRVSGLANLLKIEVPRKRPAGGSMTRVTGPIHILYVYIYIYMRVPCLFK